MRNEYIIILFILGFIAVLITGFIFSWISLTLPAIHIFGICVLLGIANFWQWTEGLRWRTDQIISRLGHHSYRSNDVKPLPWVEFKLDKGDGTQIKTVKYGNMLSVESGGINRSGISLRGGPEQLIIAAPAKYFEKIGNQIVCRANLNFTDFFELNLNMIKNYSPQVKNGRIQIKRTKKKKICTTPFAYGITSPVDKSDTGERLEYECFTKEENRVANYFKDRMDLMIEQREREIMSNNNTKPGLAILKQPSEEYS